MNPTVPTLPPVLVPELTLEIPKSQRTATIGEVEFKDFIYVLTLQHNVFYLTKMFSGFKSR